MIAFYVKAPGHAAMAFQKGEHSEDQARLIYAHNYGVLISDTFVIGSAT